MRNVVGILSYNMPHLTDSLYNQLKALVKVPAEFVVLDNGSDKDKIAASTTHFAHPNSRLTGGMNRILKEAKGVDYVWLCTNDVRFVGGGDPLATMIGKCERDPSIGCVHPGLIEPVPGYAYQWMVAYPLGSTPASPRGGCTVGVPMVDIICPLYTRAAMDANNWEFDPRFAYGWGIDYDSCLKLRRAGLTVAVDFDVLADHQTSVTYDSGRDREFKNRNEYYGKAMENMSAVMTDKYGTEWRKLFV
jgi:GT2 family glycosyltransferase